MFGNQLQRGPLFDVFGAGSAVGGVAQAAATGVAAGLQYKAASNALDLQKTVQKQQQANYQQQQANTAPYLQQGTKALGQLAGMGNFQAPTAAQAEQSPGYQFALQQGQKALNGSLVARGVTGGNAGKAITDYAQGLASTNYGDTYNRALQTYNTNANRLSGIAGYGLNANNQNAQTGANFANSSGNFANAAGNLQTQQGNALAAGITGGVGAINNQALLSKLLNGSSYGGASYGPASSSVVSDPLTGQSLPGAPAYNG